METSGSHGSRVKGSTSKIQFREKKMGVKKEKWHDGDTDECTRCSGSIESCIGGPFELAGGLLGRLCLSCWNEYMMWREETTEHDRMVEIAVEMDARENTHHGCAGAGTASVESVGDACLLVSGHISTMESLLKEHHKAKKALMEKTIKWLEISVAESP